MKEGEVSQRQTAQIKTDGKQQDCMTTKKIKTTYREAMRAAIREALLRDERVFFDG